MADILRGRVIQVIDGDSFVTRITWAHPDNFYGGYPAKVKMRLRRGDAPERGERGYGAAKKALQRKIAGRLL